MSYPRELGSTRVLSAPEEDAVRPGSLDGFGTIYDQEARLIAKSNERIEREAARWDAEVLSPWKRVLPKILFDFQDPRLHRGLQSALYITSERIVLIREVPGWGESRSRMAPPFRSGGMTAEEEVALIQRLAFPLSKGRQYLEVWPDRLDVVELNRSDRRRSFLEVRAHGRDRREFRIYFQRESGPDPTTSALIESRFPRQAAPIR